MRALNGCQKCVLAGGLILFVLSIAFPPYVVGIPGIYETGGVDWDFIDGWFRGRSIRWSVFAVEQMAIWFATFNVFLYVGDRAE